LYFICGSCSLDEVIRSNSSVTSLALPRYLTVAAALVFLFAPSFAQAASLSPSTLTKLVNAERTAAGLTALSTNAALTRAAQAKANDMAAKGYFAHTTPDGKSFSHWVVNAGYAYKSAGENLAQGFSTESGTVGAWMNSPGHRTNIMASKFSETGIAVASGTYNGKSVIFVVQMFGAPSGSAGAVAAKPAPAPKVAAQAVPKARVLGAIEKPTALPNELEAKDASPEKTPVSRTEMVAATAEADAQGRLLTLLMELRDLLLAAAGMVRA